MICPKCGKVLTENDVRCPECGAKFDAQYAPPQINEGPTLINSTRPAVIPKNVPIEKAKRSSGWIAGIAVLCLIMAAAVIFVMLGKLGII